MNPTSVCKNYATQLLAGQTFCRWCGTLAGPAEENGFAIGCEIHHERGAVGLCIICSKPVCADCEVMSHGKILCHEPEHRIMLQEWSTVHEPDSEFEADALVRNLADNGIEAKTFSLHDHVAARWVDENRVLVFVRKSDMENAISLLKELNLIDID